MRKIATSLIALALCAIAASTALADTNYQTLPFSQDWSNIGMITADDDWSGVPGVLGFRGDNLTASTGVDPQTVLGDDLPGVLDINANKPDPLAFFTGGAAEFELADPVVALTGSGTADAPYLVFLLNTGGYSNIQVAYDLRDIELGTDNSIQQVALQFRVGASGSWTNVPAGYVADASDGGLLKTTPVSVTLPAAVDNQAQVQIRVITTNAIGNDEWIGVDNVFISGTPIETPVSETTWGRVKALYR